MRQSIDADYTEWDAQLAVAQLFRYRNGNTVIPSCTTFGWEMDVCIITAAGFLYEIEIKRTLSDWKADEHKRKWGMSRAHVSKFYYAIPPELLDKKPGFVSEDTGIILLTKPSVRSNAAFRVYAEVHKQAKRLSNEKLGSKRSHMLGVFYYRYWNLRWEMALKRREPSQLVLALDRGPPLVVPDDVGKLVD